MSRTPGLKRRTSLELARDKLGRKKAVARDSPAVIKAFDALEQAIGGREELLGLVLRAPASPEQERLLGMLADPRNDTRKLGRICALGRIGVGQVVALLKDGKMARALVESVDRIARLLPEVAEDVMARSVPHLVDCGPCQGRGTVWRGVVPVGADGQALRPTADIDVGGSRVEVSCETCQGHGKLQQLPTLERQKVALEIGGLLKKAPLIDARSSTQTQNVFAFGADGTRNFRTATDKLLFAGEGGEGGGEVVDAEEVWEVQEAQEAQDEPGSSGEPDEPGSSGGASSTTPR